MKVSFFSALSSLMFLTVIVTETSPSRVIWILLLTGSLEAEEESRTGPPGPESVLAVFCITFTRPMNFQKLPYVARKAILLVYKSQKNLYLEKQIDKALETKDIPGKTG